MSSKPESRHKQIGLDRLVRLEWMEHTARLVLAGNGPEQVKEALTEALGGSFPSSNVAVRGSVDKTITILMRTWVKPPKHLDQLREKALGFLSTLPRKEHMAIHWGMTMAVYPFWGAVAAQTGRLMRLQGIVRAREVQRRVREQYGERETVSRRVRYVLRSFVDWRVLSGTSKAGAYEAGQQHQVKGVEVVAWLIEAFLLARPERLVSADSIWVSPSLFPFRLQRVAAEHLAAASRSLDVLRHGLDQELLRLRD